MAHSELRVGDEVSLEAEALALPHLLEASGLYLWTRALPWRTLPIAVEAQGLGEAGREEASSADETLAALVDDGAASGGAPANFLPAFRREELRLDVDGRYPQATASGTLMAGLSVRAHWIANLTRTSRNRWSGNIWYRHGDATLVPHTTVTIVAHRSIYPSQRRLVATFTGGSAPGRQVTYRFERRAFHPVHFELDQVEGGTLVDRIDTDAHPNRPPSLSTEELTIGKVFRRAGFAVASGGGNVIPLSDAGANGSWSDAEMHDAMQVHWSRQRDEPQWALWVLFASLHDSGTGLGGVMFDDIGPNHRQGTAIFSDSFISQAPAADANPAAWVARMRFWTACHEMGHAFNLAHSWQKDHPPEWGTPWIPLTNEVEERSFMNYPYSVAGGEVSFFSDFEFRFSDSELLFMRHAPASFVRMGDAAWFDNHGFEQAESRAYGTLALELGVSRSKAEFSFLEPVVLELALRNIARTAQAVPVSALEATDHLVVIVKKRGQTARRWSPFAQYCLERTPTLLAPGEALEQSLFAAAGTLGWDIAEPGTYTIQVLARVGEQELLSNPLELVVRPPLDRQDETLAQDYFTAEVGRVLAFDGSRYLEGANDVLRKLVEQNPDHPAATHAVVALAQPLAKRYRLLVPGTAKPGTFAVKEPQLDGIRSLAARLVKEPDGAVRTLGLTDCRYYLKELETSLAELGDNKASTEVGKVKARLDTQRRASIRASAAE